MFRNWSLILLYSLIVNSVCPVCPIRVSKRSVDSLISPLISISAVSNSNCFKSSSDIEFKYLDNAVIVRGAVNCSIESSSIMLIIISYDCSSSSESSSSSVLIRLIGLHWIKLRSVNNKSLISGLISSLCSKNVSTSGTTL